MSDDKNVTVVSGSNRSNPTVVSGSQGGQFSQGRSNPTVVSGEGVSKEESNATVLSENYHGTVSKKEKFNNFRSLCGRMITTEKGMVIKIQEIISEAGGEAIIYLGRSTYNNRYVVKLYTSPPTDESEKRRNEIIRYMQTTEGKKYTLPILDGGFCEKDGYSYRYDVMMYCEKGDLSNYKSYSFDEMKGIIKNLNEILNSIHRNGIFHRDIKEHNLFWVDDDNGENRIVLGDFGIARLKNETLSGNSTGVKTNTIALSMGYAAPEVFYRDSEGKGYYNEASEYYSLGITIANIFDGGDIYENISDEQKKQFITKDIIPFKNNAKPGIEYIKNLVNNLCKRDFNIRFGYEDVNNWLLNPEYKGTENGWTRDKVYYGVRGHYDSPSSFFEAATKNLTNWEDAKRQMFSGRFTDFFRNFHPGYTTMVESIIDKKRLGEFSDDKGLAEFLKILYPDGPLVWKGLTYTSLSELAEIIQMTDSIDIYSGMLSECIVSDWIKNTKTISLDENSLGVIERIETLAKNYPVAACSWFANAFAKTRRVEINREIISDIEGFFQYLFSDPVKYYKEDRLYYLLDYKKSEKLYGFLFSYGLYDIVMSSIRDIDKKDEFEQILVLFNMLDVMSERLKSPSITLVRDFFRQYGPLGIYEYTQQLIKNDINVYSVMDSSNNLINTIMNFQYNENQSVDNMYKDCLRLVGLVEALEKSIINPILVNAGVYGKKGIICNNAKGIFALEIYGKKAPIGFGDYFIGE